MNKLVMLSLGLMATLASAEVKMGGAPSCANPGDLLNLDYTNSTPDAWDMRGWGAKIGTSPVRGAFAAGSSGSYFVLSGAKPTYWNASCTGKGATSSWQLEAKTGSCNEPQPPLMPEALKCAEINTSATNFYNQNQCIKDGLGVNRGDGYGGFIDSYRDQTQIQVAIPAGTFTMGGQTVRFDPTASMGGPFYMMSLVALQEYMYSDMQFLAAMGAATSGAGLVNGSGASLYKSPPNTGLDDNSYGSFTVTYKTAVGRLAVDYPKYFQTPLKLEKLVSTGGAGITAANSPQQLNSAFLATMDLWWLFDGLKAAQDLCFKQFLKDAKDKSAGLKLMLGGYYIGPNDVDQGTGMDDYATHVLPTTNAALLGAADVTSYMKAFPWDAGPPAGPDHGTRNYITKVFSVVDQLTAANPQSKACGGALNIYDADITLQQVQELFFGQGGTAAANGQGNGGLLWHFQIGAAERQGLWNDLICAFGQLKGKAPSTLGRDVISYRYDFLTMLRVGRQYFAGYVNKFTDRPTPADVYSSEYSIWVTRHSGKPCGGAKQDVTWPVMTLADSVYRKGDKLTGTFTDNAGPLQEMSYTTDLQWRKWIATDANFAVPATLADTDKLWFRITDSCGNSTIQQVIVKNLPPPPQLPKPVANPKSTTFYDPLSVTLSDSLAAATILYTIDGSVPATTAGGATKLYVAGTPIVISTVTTTIKAIAVHPDWRPSDVMIETYTHVDKPMVATPTATPPGGNFSSLSAGVSVTLSSTTAGADIFYTTDGTPPATSETGTTKKYTGAPILITATTTLKAIGVKTDYLNSGIMSETYTRVVPPSVATPTANPPGKSFITPLSVTLSTATAGADIFYTTDGTPPASSETGTTKKYTGPIAVSVTTTIQAIGIKSDLLPSSVMTEKYVFTPPVAVATAYYKDLDGDGRIETVIVEFAKDIPALPDKIGFKLVELSVGTQDKTAAKGEIAFAAGSSSKLVVTLKDPFLFGATSVNNRDVSGHLFAQDNIPLVDNNFAIDDSVPPVVFKAGVQEPDSANPEKRITVTLSEDAAMPLGSQTVLVWKHNGVEASSDKVKISKILKTGDRVYVVYVDSNSQVLPILGDSVALNTNGEIMDGNKNVPARKTFHVLEGERPRSKPADVFVTFPNGTKDKASDGPEAQGNWVFIPMNESGIALSGNPADGKCAGSCFTGDAGRFVGPVFHIVTPGPVSYDFTIFNNVGEFLAKGHGYLNTDDLGAMHRSGGKYTARVVWTGYATDGRKAGTGAYILQATLTTDKDDRTGAAPATTRKRIKFGLLRSLRGS